MPREQVISITTGSVRRDYCVLYEDDSPERAEAVRFFQEAADCRLFPTMDIPPIVGEMPIEVANAYLRCHPMQERWSILTIGGPVPDDDLARLQFLPEITQVKVFSNGITDAGVKHLLHLRAVSSLILYSSRVTDRCLGEIRQLRSLISLDLQAAPNLSREAVLASVNAMPWLKDVWPPPDPVRLAESQRRSRLAAATPVAAEPARPPDGKLRFVDLSWRPMRVPPSDIFESDDIERLDMISCELEVLPDAIGKLTRLRTLYANWGRLTELPSTIGRLTALECLWLNDNLLSQLPDEVRSLKSLTKLKLDGNMFKSFPAAILGLERLEELGLRGNRIASVPEELGSLTELRHINLGGNQLKELPSSIGRLNKLTFLGLQDNPIRSLPDELWRLPCLITLCLERTAIANLPSEASRIPHIVVSGQRVHT